MFGKANLSMPKIGPADEGEAGEEEKKNDSQRCVGQDHSGVESIIVAKGPHSCLPGK